MCNTTTTKTNIKKHLFNLYFLYFSYFFFLEAEEERPRAEEVDFFAAAGEAEEVAFFLLAAELERPRDPDEVPTDACFLVAEAETDFLLLVLVLTGVPGVEEDLSTEPSAAAAAICCCFCCLNFLALFSPIK